MEENKQILLEKAKKLAEKHEELKLVVIKILNDMDSIELEYNEIVKKIKSK